MEILMYGYKNGIKVWHITRQLGHYYVYWHDKFGIADYSKFLVYRRLGNAVKGAKHWYGDVDKIEKP